MAQTQITPSASRTYRYSAVRTRLVAEDLLYELNMLTLEIPRVRSMADRWLDASQQAGLSLLLAQNLQRLRESNRDAPTQPVVTGDCEPEAGVTSTSSRSPTTPTSPPIRVSGRKHIEGRMLRMISQNREALGWSARDWAIQLKCSPSTVCETPVWRIQIPRLRVGERNERAALRNRKARSPRHDETCPIVPSE